MRNQKMTPDRSLQLLSQFLCEWATIIPQWLRLGYRTPENLVRVVPDLRRSGRFRLSKDIDMLYLISHILAEWTTFDSLGIA
jgi:hypothetical protein